MTDNLLTLRDILDLKLEGIRLALLSACETGLPGSELPDEVLSLPTGLLQAGVAGIIASLWSVSDASTLMLISRFYDYWKADNLPPAEALRQAQIWVRDTTNGEKASHFEALMEQTTDETLSDIAYTLYEAFAFREPSDRDFSHPFYWAAFSYTGM